jgi:hypothetical protein
MKLYGSCLLLLAAGVIHAADPALADLLPANTAIVFGIRLRPVFEALEKQGVMKDLRQQAALLLLHPALSGFDPFQDIDEILVASTGAGQDAPGLAMMTGRFHAASPGTLTVHQGSKQVTALLSDSIMLAGDRSLVEAAIHGRTGSARAPALLADRIGEMRGQYTLWGFADRLDARRAGLAAGPKELESIDGFSFGVAMEDGLALAAAVHLRSAKDAEELAALLREWEKAAKAAPANAAPKVEIESTRDTIKLAIRMTGEELARAVAAQRAAVGADLKMPVRAAPELTTDANGNTLRLTLPGKR